MASLNCDICTKTDNHCCKADTPLDIPIALALVEISGLTNLAITETPKFTGSVFIVDKNWFTDQKINVFSNIILDKESLYISIYKTTVGY